MEDTKSENKNEGPEEGFEEKPKFSEKTLIISIVIIVLFFIAIMAFSLLKKPQPKTVEDLHLLNLKEKLKPEQGYLYNGIYSFIKVDNLWYTQLKSPKGQKLYDLALRFSPRELEGIPIEGKLNDQFFNNQSQFYYTFSPKGNNLQYVALAVADFSTHMSRVFEKMPIAACILNETISCYVRPIVTCDNKDDKDKLILQINESKTFKVHYDNNCIIVEGEGFDLIKGVDRVLYNLYGVMGKG